MVPEMSYYPLNLPNDGRSKFKLEFPFLKSTSGQKCLNILLQAENIEESSIIETCMLLNFDMKLYLKNIPWIKIFTTITTIM